MNNILPDFQKYLFENKLAPQKNVSFYALWASKFLSFSNKNQDKEISVRIRLFLDLLEKDQKLPHWQGDSAT